MVSHNIVHNKYISHQWFVVARSVNVAKDNLVQLVAFPGLECKDDDLSMARPSYYLTGFMKMPKGSVVKELGFYGDDGNSSLSVGSSDKNDVELCRPEGRQALILLVHREAKDDNMTDGGFAEELWSVKYDELVFRAVNTQTTSERLTIDSLSRHDSVSKISFNNSRNNGEEFGTSDDTLLARSKSLVHNLF